MVYFLALGVILLDLKIKRLSELDNSYQAEVAQLFVEGYYKDLKFLTENRKKLSHGLEHIFNADIIYVALDNRKIVGMLACANNKKRALTLNKQEYVKHFGYFKGRIAFNIMSKIFHAPLDYSDDTTYIEVVATGETSRGKGVASSLMKYVFEKLSYTNYVLEVTDVNKGALTLYEKLGYQEFKRVQAKFPKLAGFNYSIYMKKSKINL